MPKPAARNGKPQAAKDANPQYPPPFTPAPANLASFLKLLNRSEIYITHVDRLPIPQKQTIFLSALAINSTIFFILAWRAYVAGPQYLALAKTLLGYVSSATVDVASTTRGEQFWILAKRTAMMTADFFLFRFASPWVYGFFLEQPCNPALWRWKLGFFKEEVIVRVSRNWAGEDLMQGSKRGAESPFFKTRVLPAVSGDVMGKTGYLMMGRDWDLDFAVMVKTHDLIRSKTLGGIGEVDCWVWAHGGDGIGWLGWHFEGTTPSGTGSEDVGAEIRKVVEGT